MPSHVNRLIHGIANPSDAVTAAWLDLATLAMPQNNREAYAWYEYIFEANGTYREAQRRRLAYFLTDLNIRHSKRDQTLSEEEKDKWYTHLSENLNLVEFILQMLMDREAYGEAIVSPYFPFYRWLLCPRCTQKDRLGTRVRLSAVLDEPKRYGFRWKPPQFHLVCPSCSYSGPFEVRDVAGNLSEKMRLIRWSPSEIHVEHDRISGASEYSWEPPEDYVQQVKDGEPLVLLNAPEEMLKAAARRQIYKFDSSYIYHAKYSGLSGRKSHGRGVSPIIYSFRNLFHYQLIRRHDEGIVLDETMPFRTISPVPSSEGTHGTGPLKLQPMPQAIWEIKRMLNNRFRDPLAYHFVPFPVQLNQLSGQARQLAPHEAHQFSMDTLLNDARMPTDFYRGTLQQQAALMAVRLFESVNADVLSDINAFLKWVSRLVSDVLGWEEVRVSMRPSTLADDLEARMILLQLAMQGKVSETTALRQIGLSRSDEKRLQAEELLDDAEMQAMLQEEAEQAAMGQAIAQGAPAGGPQQGAAMGGAGVPPGGEMQGGPVGGAGPGFGAGGSNFSAPNQAMGLPELEQLAEDYANQLLYAAPQDRSNALREMREQNDTLHRLVTARLAELRSELRSAGQQMLIQQGQEQGTM